jgi:hypothetical protein
MLSCEITQCYPCIIAGLSSRGFVGHFRSKRPEPSHRITPRDARNFAAYEVVLSFVCEAQNRVQFSARHGMVESDAAHAKDQRQDRHLGAAETKRIINSSFGTATSEQQHTGRLSQRSDNDIDLLAFTPFPTFPAFLARSQHVTLHVDSVLAPLFRCTSCSPIGDFCCQTNRCIPKHAPGPFDVKYQVLGKSSRMTLKLPCMRAGPHDSHSLPIHSWPQKYHESATRQR